MEIRRTTDDICELEGSLKSGLLSRLVNYQPLTHEKLKVKSYPLDQVKSQRVQESLVVRDLLFVLVGLEGVYIRYNNSYEPRGAQQSDELRGPEFKIAKNMDPSLKNFAKWIVKLGKMYVVLTTFTERYSEPLYGAVLHRLCYEIRSFLIRDYMKCLVDVAEVEFKQNPEFGIRELGQLLSRNCVYKMQLLYEIAQDISREMGRRALVDRDEADFQNFMQDLKMEKEVVENTRMLFTTDSRISAHACGGVILQMVQDKVKNNWGNQRNVDFLQGIFRNISTQYCKILDRWLKNGSLEDPYDEFMVADTAKSSKGQVPHTINSLTSERLWDTQYVIRKDGLMDQFKEGDVAFKVLMTGKALHMFRTCCDLQDLESVASIEMPRSLQELPHGTQLTLYVDAHYERANQLAGKLFYEGYNLPQVLREFQSNFLLYNNATFFRKFFNRSLVDLIRLRSDAVQTKLQRTFEEYQSSVQNPVGAVVLPLMNLQLDKRTYKHIIEQFSSETAPEGHDAQLLQARNFGNLRDMLLRDLDVQELSASGELQQLSGSHYCIHYMQFEIIVPYPLNTLISKTCVVQYQMIQRHILLLHYYNKILQDTWFELNKNKVWRHRGFGPDVARWIRRCRVVHNRMSQFMKLMLEYTSQDVVEAGWRDLAPRMGAAGEAKFDLAEWQALLEHYLANLMSHSLLTNASMVRLLVQITDIVHKYCKFVTSLRKTLCGLDLRLYSHYRAQLPAEHHYDEAAALAKLRELQRYVMVVSERFEQHQAAFAEGARYYCDQGSTRAGGNPVLALADRLSQLTHVTS